MDGVDERPSGRTRFVPCVSPASRTAPASLQMLSDPIGPPRIDVQSSHRIAGEVPADRVSPELDNSPAVLQCWNISYDCVTGTRWSPVSLMMRVGVTIVRAYVSGDWST